VPASRCRDGRIRDRRLRAAAPARPGSPVRYGAAAVPVAARLVVNRRRGNRLDIANRPLVTGTFGALANTIVAVGVVFGFLAQGSWRLSGERDWPSPPRREADRPGSEIR